MPEQDTATLLSQAQAELEPIMGQPAATALIGSVRAMLEGAQPGSLDTEGVRNTLFQIVRNRDAEMKMNHVTELKVCCALARVRGRILQLEMQVSERNARRVDFAALDGDHTLLIELKNLNRPMIKKASDAVTESLRRGLRGLNSETDLHLVYLFFRRPREQDVPQLRRLLAEQWKSHVGAAPRVFFVPPQHPRVAAILTPARPDTGGRVLVYDHGDHLMSHPGQRLAASVARRVPSPRERMEELFIKDNILRRLQDAELKFPLHSNATTRVIAFALGDWAPYERLLRYLRHVCHWYREGTALNEDEWGEFYPLWAQRWRFHPEGNIDACVALGGATDLNMSVMFAADAGILSRIFSKA